MLKRFALFVLSFCLAASVTAQLIEVSGKVQADDTRESLIGASVQLISPGNPALNQGAPTELDGSFRFRVSPGEYVLKVTYIGYNPSERALTIGSVAPEPLLIKLEPNSLILDQAEVTGTAVRAEQIGDTTQFNADAYKVNPDATAEQLLEKMPGVVIQDGRVEAQGEAVQDVMVDGKPFFGNDPNAALKNIPAQMVDKIQIYDQQSDQAKFTGFDDGETRKTVNIITKPDYRTGTFGRLHAGAGTEESYKAGGVLNSFNEDRRITVMVQVNNVNEQNFASEDLSGVAAGNGGGRRRWDRGNVSSNVNDFLVSEQGGIATTEAIGINFSDDWAGKLEMSSSYFFNRIRNTASNSLFRQYILEGDSGQVYSESNLSASNNMNHRFNLRLKYTLNDRNTLIFRPSFSLQQSNGTNTVEGISTQAGSFLNSTDNVLSTEFDAWNAENFMLWQHSFSKKGRSLSLDLNQNFRSNKGERFLFAENLFSEEALSDTLDQFADLNGFEQEHRLDISFTEPLSEEVQLVLTYEPSYLLNQSDRETFNYFSPEENYSIRDTALSNVFESSFIIHEGGPGVRWNKGKVSFLARAHYQQTRLQAEQEFPFELDVERDFRAFLPLMRVRINISKEKNFFVVMRSRANVPGINQLQSVIDNSNPIQLSSGNPDLNQAVSHFAYSRYSSANPAKGTMFNASLRASYTQDYIGNSTIIATSTTVLENGLILPTGARFSQPVNLDGQASLNGSMSYGFPVRILKSNLNAEFNASMNRTPALINGQENIAFSPGLGGGLSLSSSFSTKFDFTLSVRPQLNFVVNSLTPEADSRFVSQNSRIRLYWNFYQKLVYRTEASHTLFTGLSEDFNQNFLLWNMSLGTKLFKEDQAEVFVSVFDALQQNTSISRTVSESTIDDLQTVVLQRYIMINFVWNIKAFGKGAEANSAPSGRGRNAE